MIEQLWDRLKAWGKKYAPAMIIDLNPGASETEILKLQNEIGLTLPNSFIRCLKLHNGEFDGWPYKVFANYGAYLSCSEILQNWKARQRLVNEVISDFTGNAYIKELIQKGAIKPEGPVEPVIFNHHWIPFMDRYNDTFWALDFAPTEGGHAGQIIEVSGEGTAWRVIADSFDTFFKSYIHDLEADKYQVIDGFPAERPKYKIIA